MKDLSKSLANIVFLNLLLKCKNKFKSKKIYSYDEKGKCYFVEYDILK